MTLRYKVLAALAVAGGYYYFRSVGFSTFADYLIWVGLAGSVWLLGFIDGTTVKHEEEVPNG